MEKPREPKVGDAVIFFDELRRELNALITAVHGEVSGGPVEGHPDQKWYVPCINLVFVTPEKGKTDSWGRQTGHNSSCVHVSSYLQPVGNYWCWPDEVESSRPMEDKVQTQK
jgi:hypothetical protein